MPNIAIAGDIPFRCVGTVIFGSDKNAILEESSGMQEIYQEGNAAPGGYKIKKILADRIVLAKDGVDTILPFLNGTGTASPDSAVQDNFHQNTLARMGWNRTDGAEEILPPSFPQSENPDQVVQFLMPGTGVN